MCSISTQNLLCGAFKKIAAGTLSQMCYLSIHKFSLFLYLKRNDCVGALLINSVAIVSGGQ